MWKISKIYSYSHTGPGRLVQSTTVGIPSIRVIQCVHFHRFNTYFVYQIKKMFEQRKLFIRFEVYSSSVFGCRFHIFLFRFSFFIQCMSQLAEFSNHSFRIFSLLYCRFSTRLLIRICHRSMYAHRAQPTSRLGEKNRKRRILCGIFFRSVCVCDDDDDTERYSSTNCDRSPIHVHLIARHLSTIIISQKF